MTEPRQKTDVRFSDALLAAALVAVDPAGLGGISVRARPGPVRDLWTGLAMETLAVDRPVRRMPANISPDRLAGGLDLAATLAAGTPIYAQGIIASCNGGVLVAPMAERIAPVTAALLAIAMDEQRVAPASAEVHAFDPARFGVILFDEGEDDSERAPASLLDRVALHLDLDGIPISTATAQALDARLTVDEARDLLPSVTLPDEATDAVCAAAATLGIHSIRAPLLALRTARHHAALHGRQLVTAEDLAVAARLVLAPRATQIPPFDDEQPEPAPPEPEQDPEAGKDEQGEDDQPSDPSLNDIVLQAVRTNLPPHLLDDKTPDRRRTAGKIGARGKSGAGQENKLHGRPAGSRRGDPRAGERLCLYETLRAAAPWQRVRRAQTAGSVDPPSLRSKVIIRREDFRVKRYTGRRVTTAIFVVDASGSAASQRLGEAKGAIELILRECYVRRDQVALISFRGVTAELLLPPTRSLTRAKRSLAALPGGGGTPIASGLDAAWSLADHLKRQGQTPLVVVLTDGRANVTRDGKGNRPRAREEAMLAARRLMASGQRCLLLDVSLRGSADAALLAEGLGARYMLIPGGDSSRVATAVSMARQDLESTLR